MRITHQSADRLVFEQRHTWIGRWLIFCAVLIGGLGVLTIFQGLGLDGAVMVVGAAVLLGFGVRYALGHLIVAFERGNKRLEIVQKSAFTCSSKSLPFDSLNHVKIEKVEGDDSFIHQPVLTRTDGTDPLPLDSKFGTRREAERIKTTINTWLDAARAA